MTADGKFASACAVVLKAEGVFSDDARDHGGATKYGITQATLSEWRERQVTVEEVQALTEDEATEIYREMFWNAYRCGDMPWRWALAIFDARVNEGTNAVRWAQRALQVPEDGHVGDRTLAAMTGRYADDALDGFMALRAEHYMGLPTFAIFGHGWLRRTYAIHRKGLQLAPAA